MELPIELQAEILVRLPVRCLLICKCICKTFYIIIRDPNFAYTHFTRTSFSASEQALILQFKTFIGISHFLFSIDNTVLFSSPWVPQIPFVGELHLVASANGLVCFHVFTTYGHDNYLLWNPVTRQTRYLPEPEDAGFSGGAVKEFGFVPETNDYIFLRVGSISGSDRILIHLYKMSMDSWTILDCSSLTDFDSYDGNLNPDRSLYRNNICVFLNGCFHWAANGHVCHFIVSFNLKDEQLGLIKTPNHDNIYKWDVAMIEESLAVMYWSDGDNFQIWVMNDYGVEDSWALRFRISKTLCPTGCWKDNLFISTRRSLSLYNLNTRKRKKISRSQTGHLTSFSSFVLTLAPVRLKGHVGDTCRGQASEENPSRRESKRQVVEESNAAPRRPRITDSTDVHTLGCSIVVGENQGWYAGRNPPCQIVDNFNFHLDADHFATLSEEQFMTETKCCFGQFAANFARLCEEFCGEDLEKSDNELKEVKSPEVRSKNLENSGESFNKRVDDLNKENKRLSVMVTMLDQEKINLLQELSRLKEEAKSRDTEIIDLKDHLKKNDYLLKEIRNNLDVADDELANAHCEAAGSVQTGYQICFKKFVDDGADPTFKSWEDYLVELHNKVNPDEDIPADIASKDINNHGNRSGLAHEIGNDIAS